MASQLSQQLAHHLRTAYFGGNWTSVHLKEHLDTVDWQHAITKVDDLNTIAALVFHLNYYVEGVKQVLEGGPLETRDKFSFDLQPFSRKSDWDQLVHRSYEQAEALAVLIEQLPEAKLWDDFTDPKYGTYYRNLQGITEHVHYHLGQIVLLKKLQAEMDRPG